MKKLICLLGFLAIVLTSCSSGGDSSTTTESDVLVKRTIKTYASSGSVVTVDHTYNGKKALKSTNSNGYYELYTYTGDLITQVKNYNPADELEETETFTYNAGNQLTSYVRVQLTANTGVKVTFVYNTDGTVSTTSYSGTAVSQTTVLGNGTSVISGGEIVMELTSSGSMHTYTYDTKNNPYKNITGFDKITIIGAGLTDGIHHNILTNTDGAGYVYNTAYTYNTMNFPLTAAKSEGTEAISTTEYIYY